MVDRPVVAVKPMLGAVGVNAKGPGCVRSINREHVFGEELCGQAEAVRQAL